MLIMVWIVLTNLLQVMKAGTHYARYLETKSMQLQAHYTIILDIFRHVSS
jgi:hypothetical protein